MGVEETKKTLLSDQVGEINKAWSAPECPESFLVATFLNLFQSQTTSGNSFVSTARPPPITRAKGVIRASISKHQPLGRRRPWHYFFRYESHSESGRGNCDLVSFTWSCVHLDFDGNVRTIIVSFFSHPHRFIPFRLPLTSTPTAMQVRGQASDKPCLIMIISIYPKFASIRNVGHEPGPCRCVFLTGGQHR